MATFVIFLVVIGGILIFLHPEKSEPKQILWEVLVPASGNDNQVFTYEHHKKWDDYVKSVAGGLTIFRTGKGEWVNVDGRLFKDRVIPVKIKCTKKDIKKIVKFTIEHYNQEAVFAYKVSNKVLIIDKEGKNVVSKREVHTRVHQKE